MDGFVGQVSSKTFWPVFASEDDTAEAEFSIIGQVDRIIELGVFHDGDDRPENLFAGHPHVRGDIGEHRRLDKEAICQFTGGFPTAGGDAASRVGTRRDSVEGLTVTFERGTYEFKLGRLPQHEAAGVRALLNNAAGA